MLETTFDVFKAALRSDPSISPSDRSRYLALIRVKMRPLELMGNGRAFFSETPAVPISFNQQSGPASNLDFFASARYIQPVRIAFKEWSVVVDALGRGEQIIILRKGGIGEGRGGFTPDHSAFLLFPTHHHQQRERVVPSAQSRFDQLHKEGKPPDRVRLEFTAEVVFSRYLESFAEAEALRGQHIWRDEVIADRFAWGKSEAIFALAVRVARLVMPVELPLRSNYSGCKSWVELEHDVSIGLAQPVLDDLSFAGKLKQFQSALQRVTVVL